jgi:hypothetical protein
MDDPADLRIQAAGWRLLATFYGSGSEALLETASFLETRAAELERRGAQPDRANARPLTRKSA